MPLFEVTRGFALAMFTELSKEFFAPGGFVAIPLPSRLPVLQH